MSPKSRSGRRLRQSFAANLRRERKKLGLSQEALAHEAGLDRSYVGQVERGECNISIDNIERLAQALGIEATILMWPGSPIHTREGQAFEAMEQS